MNQATGGEDCKKSGFDDGKCFIVYTNNAHVLKDFEKRCGGAAKIVGRAFLWFIGMPYEKFDEHSMEGDYFRQLQLGCLFNEAKSTSGAKGGAKSGEVRKHQAECRKLVFKDIEDIRGALRSGDLEVDIQAVMEYCKRRGDREFENALRKLGKQFNVCRFEDLCERVITTEKEPKNRSDTIVGILEKSLKASATAQATEKEAVEDDTQKASATAQATEQGEVEG